MRLTKRGQVTIPVEFRRELGLRPGDEIEIEQVGDTLVLSCASQMRSRGQKMVDRLRGSTGGSGLTTDEIMKLTRGG